MLRNFATPFASSSSTSLGKSSRHRSSRRRGFIALSALAIFVVGLGAAPAQAEDGPGTKRVRDVNDRIAKSLRSKDAESVVLKRARKELGGFLNIEELAARAMRDHWEKLSAEQRQQFVEVLRSLIETNYLKGLRANLKYAVSYKGEKRDGDQLLVRSVVTAQRRGRPVKIEIDYVLSMSKALGKPANAWRMFDMKTDGVGLVENYRAMFNKIIAKSGFDGLVKKMNKKLASLKK